MSPTTGLVIIGQGPAGTAAANAFRELDGTTPVTILSAEPYACYSRPRLPEVISGKVQSLDICLHPPTWYTERRIELRLDEKVMGLDIANRTVTTHHQQIIPYHRLILAMGAEPMVPPISGLPTQYSFVLRTLEDALALRAWAQGKKSAILIGGGLLGLEAGFALTQLGLKVLVVELASRLLPRQLDEEASALLQEMMIPMGFEFFLGVKVERIQTQAEQTSIELNDGRKLVGALAVMSAGIIPSVSLAQTAGIRLGKRGVMVDDSLLTSVPGVWAAGDVAEWQGQVAGLWTVAQAMGRIAGVNAAGGQESYTGSTLATKLKVAGIDLWSQGEINPDGAMVLAKRNPGQGQLMKLFIRDHRLVGSIHMGDSHSTQKFKKLIDHSIPINGFEEQLLNDDFDFKQIPGFITQS